MVKKNRILYIQRFLETQTDEAHPATMAGILAHLESTGIPAGRKAVASDIEQLIDAGIDVVCDKTNGKSIGYFVGDRHLEIPELKLLIDAVQASKFISAKKSKALIKKLTSLASVHQSRELDRHLYADKNIKSLNDKSLITVDLLNTAISGEKKVRFKYYEYDRNKNRIYKHKRQVYTLSPYGLIWSGDRYYVIGFSEAHGKAATFRVDRIAVPELTDIPAVPVPEGCDTAGRVNTVFKMYDGPIRNMTLKCENEMMDNIIDRFGEDADTEILDEEHFIARVHAAVSPAFFGWLFTYAGKINIYSPREVAEEFISMIKCFKLNQ